MDKKTRIVIDTNILASAFRSKRGASFKLLSCIGDEIFTFVFSVPVVLEYEEVLKKKYMILEFQK